MKTTRFFNGPLLGLAFTFWLFLLPDAQAQDVPADESKRYSLSGRVKDVATGEDIIGAGIYLRSNGDAKPFSTLTNNYGFYSITVPAGNYEAEVRYMGYQALKQKISLQANQSLNFSIRELPPLLDSNGRSTTKAVDISARRADENVQSVKMSAIKLDAAQIKKLPVLFGEVDILKNIQTLPGVVTAGEGTTGFFVRGGSADQNLILLDEAPVYNPSHLLGFFSVFNGDALQNAELYKAGIPAEYGGRLSSLLDVRTRNGNNQRLSGSGGIGLISSRLTLEGPIVKDKASWIVSGRRTYLDQFLRLSNNEATRSSKLYFYDLNAKVNFDLGKKDRLYVAGYFGRDVFSFGSQFGVNWGNATGTVRWNHVTNDRLFSNTTLVFSNFDYQIGANQDALQSFTWTSKLQEVNLKHDYTYYLAPENYLRFGAQVAYRSFQPGRVKPSSGQSVFSELIVPSLHAAEVATYVSQEVKLNSHWQLQYGARLTAFAQIGEGTEYRYNGAIEEANKIDSVTYKSFAPMKWYFAIEPRFSARYLLNEQSSLKFSYNRTNQFLHLLSNNTSPLPFAVWLPSTRYIRPQVADQIAGGYFRNLFDNQVEVSVEAFYKYFGRVTDFKDNAQIVLNKTVETEVRQGTGQSYGLEFFVRKHTGRLTGWVSYTLMEATRTIPDVNAGARYFADYDRRNTINVVGNYLINRKWDASMAFIYSTGRPMSLPSGFYQYDYINVPVYSERNGYRQPDFHRLDVSVNYTPRPQNRERYHSTWNFGVYNLYGRKNPFSVYVEDRTDDKGNVIAGEKRVMMLYLFRLIPFVTWNFKF